mgnify:CR=1 FL=1
MLVKLNVHEQNYNFIRALETFYPEVSFNDIEGLEKQVLRARSRIINAMDNSEVADTLVKCVELDDLEGFTIMWRNLNVSMEDEGFLADMFYLLKDEVIQEEFKKLYIKEPTKILYVFYRKLIR